MLAENPLIELEWRIERHYCKYVIRRLLGASIFALAVSFSITALVYDTTSSLLFSGLSLLFSGWFFQSLFIRFFVPKETFLDESKVFITGAVALPARIKQADGKVIIIEDEEGVDCRLNRMERRIWDSAILPYIIEENKRVEAQRRNLQGDPSNRMASRRTELNEWEEKMQRERVLLKTERQRLEKRIKQLQKNEKGGAGAGTALGRAGIGPSAEAAQEERVRLEKKSSELETAARELEERTKYVNYVEDSLVDRLNELTRREAELEQKEINSGIHGDD